MAKEKSDWEKAMDEGISEIEAGIGDCLAHGWTPQFLVGNANHIYVLLRYLKVEADWTDKEGVYIAFGDGSVPLRILRSSDVPSTQIWVR